MNAGKPAKTWRIAALLGVTTLLAQCHSGSDSGTGRHDAQFSGVFSGIVTEDGAGTAVGRVAVSGVDRNGNPLALGDQLVAPSDQAFGTYRVLNGQWTYTLDNAHAAVQSLDVGEWVEDTFTLYASDQSSRVVTIRIDGAEDVPRIVGDDTGVVAKGRWTAAEGKLSIVDVDSSDNPIGFADMPPIPGSEGLGSFELKNETWTYRLDAENPNLDSLEIGEFLVDSHVFEASDGSQFKVAVSVYSAPSPNFVVVMADDLGFADVGFNGSQDIPTPNIDSIAANGVHFVQGTASHSFCSPTRAGFLTGRYQQRFGHVYNPKYAPDDPTYGLPLDEVLLADVLADAGYVTGLIGKWHLGAAPQFHPNERGFQEFFGFLGGGHDYFRSTSDDKEHTTALLRNEMPLEEHPGYLTEAFSGEAVSFIRRHAVVPFFLFLSYNAPHSPLQATAEYEERFLHIADPDRRLYAAMVSALDDGVGDVIKALRDEKLVDSTLIVFLGDNGGVIKNGATNGFTGKKATFYEGGIRVPFAMQWIGELPEGVRYDHQVSSLDLFATIVAAAGAQVPTDRTYDGVNLLTYIEASGGDIPHKQLFWRHGGADSDWYAVREERLKLLSEDDGTIALYDLVSDPDESTDISDARPEEVRRLQEAYVLWNSEMTAPVAFPPKKAVARE